MTYNEVVYDLNQFIIQHGISTSDGGVIGVTTNGQFTLSVMTRQADSPAREHRVTAAPEIAGNYDLRRELAHRLRFTVIKRHILDINGYYFDETLSSVPDYVKRQVNNAASERYS